MLNRATLPPFVLLYDGSCGFCLSSVQFVLAHERRNTTLAFASLQSAFGTTLGAEYPGVCDGDALVWYERTGSDASARLYVRSEAVIRVLKYLGGPWTVVAFMARAIPLRIRDAIYRGVAPHRFALAGRVPVCIVPTEAQRGRFLASIPDLPGSMLPATLRRD
jgi:predicted DCC family thiol-disulfide oxidoreductase YuxK